MISDEDRKLIDEAIAAGRVKVIPEGVRAMRAEYVFKESTNRIVLADRDLAKRRARAGLKWGRGK